VPTTRTRILAMNQSQCGQQAHRDHTRLFDRDHFGRYVQVGNYVL
jgi:hypothetical protein